MYRRALAIDEASLGPDHPDAARGLTNLAHGQVRKIFGRLKALERASGSAAVTEHQVDTVFRISQRSRGRRPGGKQIGRSRRNLASGLLARPDKTIGNEPTCDSSLFCVERPVAVFSKLRRHFYLQAANFAAKCS
jgi:hypothetical protein